jgi:hypothetical protein
VSSGVNTQDAVVPEVVAEVDPLAELAEVLPLPQPLSAATPAPPRISIKRLRVSCKESRESLMGFRGFLVVSAPHFTASVDELFAGPPKPSR